MEFTKAQVVRSLAGHDSGTLYWVLGTAGEKVLLSDGKRKKQAKPKHKSPKHLALVGESGHPDIQRLRAGQTVSDSELRRALAAFRDQLAQGGNHAWQKTI